MPDSINLMYCLQVRVGERDCYGYVRALFLVYIRDAFGVCPGNVRFSMRNPAFFRFFSRGWEVRIIMRSARVASCRLQEEKIIYYFLLFLDEKKQKSTDCT